MYRTTTRFAAFYILTLWMVDPCPAEGEFDLTLRLEAGATYALVFGVTQEILQNIEGTEQNVSHSMEITYRFDVKEIGAQGNAACRVTFQQIVFEQKSSLGTVRYDSRDRETPREKIPEVAREFAALLNQGFEFTVSPSGEILRLEGMGPIIDRILKEMPLSQGPERALMKRSLENQFGDATQRNILQNLFAVLSGRRVKVGETWGKTIKVERGFPMILEHSWRLDGLCDGTAKIGIASKISSLPEARPVEMGQMRMTYDISGKQTGILELNENTRWMVRGEIKQEFSGRARAVGVSMVPDGLTWPIRVKTAVTIRTM